MKKRMTVRGRREADGAPADGAAGAGASPGARGAVALLVAVLSAAPVQAAEVSLTAVSREAPSFSLTALDGSVVDDAALTGKHWIVNFWATWCPPCIEEMPAMNAAREALDPASIGMLAVNVGESPKAIEAFLEEVPIDFPVLLGDGALTLPDWGASALPTTLVVDADGRVILEAVGPRDWDDPGLLERLAALADD